MESLSVNHKEQKRKQAKVFYARYRKKANAATNASSQEAPPQPRLKILNPQERSSQRIRKGPSRR